jgi:hypothetical protein
MNRLAKILFIVAFSIIPAACKRSSHYRGPQVEKPVVLSYASHPPGSSLQDLIDDFNLDHAEVRYHKGLPDNRKSAVYFMEEGNLHVEAQQNENGEWILLSTPYLEPLDLPIENRLSKWDASVEPDSTPR